MMGGSSFEDDQEFTSRTLVLVGRTGNGKSATGNSILGKKMFESRRSFYGVTSTSVLKTTMLENGQKLNVIDTPGLFDSSLDIKFIGKEIISCINMTTDGIHAVLLVLSALSRFLKEEEDAINSLQALFGRKVFDHMIVVFTGGDELDQDGLTLEDLLFDCPIALKETLCLCGYRCVLFDNRTEDQTKRQDQMRILLSLVNMVSEMNDGRPYTNEMFTGLKELPEQREKMRKDEFMRMFEMESQGQTDQKREEEFIRIFEMVESKLMEITLKLEQQLAVEQAARVIAEENAKTAQKKSDEEIRKMKEKVESKFKETNLRLEQQLAEEQAHHVNAKENAKAAEKKPDEEIRKLLERAKQREQEFLRKSEMQEFRWQCEKLALKRKSVYRSKQARSVTCVIL